MQHSIQVFNNKVFIEVINPFFDTIYDAFDLKLNKCNNDRKAKIRFYFGNIPTYIIYKMCCVIFIKSLLKRYTK